MIRHEQLDRAVLQRLDAQVDDGKVEWVVKYRDRRMKLYNGRTSWKRRQDAAGSFINYIGYHLHVLPGYNQEQMAELYQQISGIPREPYAFRYIRGRALEYARKLIDDGVVQIVQEPP